MSDMQNRSQKVPSGTARVKVPDRFYEPARQQGHLERMIYQSREYAGDGGPSEKAAMVYLPYGYEFGAAAADSANIAADGGNAEKKTERRRYNILYLMHGSGGTEIEYMGSEGEPNRLKNMVDHMIEEKMIDPMIFVMPTFPTENLEECRSRALSFPKELLNDLIPVVETRYSTFADDVTPEGLKKSRDNRAFGGFSLGSVTTWAVFAEAMDVVKYYLPMSGDCWKFEHFGGREHPELAAAFLSRAAISSGYTRDDYFIFAATGTEDSAYEILPPQLAEMKKYPETFAYTEKDFSGGNTIYYLAEGNKHGYRYTYEYIFNALPLFFHRQDEQSE